MNKRTWIIFIVICVAIFGGLIAASRGNKADVSNVDANKVLGATEGSGNIADHTFGKTDSKVILVEYGDFQCPYCGSAHPQVKKITEEFKDKITFVFRNFPLTAAHPNAKAAASAAEAAGLQGKYWEMHNMLYESQEAWSLLTTTERTDKFASYAKAVGVKDTEKFKKEMGSTNVDAKVGFDLALGKKVGVSATPTFIINGKKVAEDVSSSVINGDGAKMRDALNDALK